MNARELANLLGYEVGYNETLQKIYFQLKKSIISKLKFIKGR